ncbi:MAG: class I SAM-dependent methyltransferase [Methylobacterium sp.]|nr:class I SAM-dependent methyltransferase [Methylobacterium sp.]MCA3601499.1 class I SAM-dependent methyltransferase [Methylobacterium sp.]MCA3610621.1 class I SAM-dependent methyltransferase [Methylobacterium sp.]MCA3617188.1 class I SAM-dependent methyltransferase [Methylobacterium sp.]MCA3622299.1 class I SAM-dependent methyltransferase [Methylobacterium sp.]
MPKLLATIRNQIPLTRYAYRGEEAPCNLCGSHHRLIISQSDRRLKTLKSVACEQCGLIRTDPMPTDAELDAYYAGEYRLDYQFAFSKKPPRFHITRSQRDAEARLALLEPALSGPKRVLDFGSGSGEFLVAAAKAGHAVEGIEPGETFAAFSREAYGVKVESRVWQQAEFAPGSFDVITSNHVLEHLREPVNALKRMAEWLAEDGVLFVSVPNALGKRQHSFQHFHFAHVYNFTPQALVWVGLVAGLEPDPRFMNAGTTVVFRKRKEGAAVPAWGEGEGHRVASHFEPSSPLRFLLSGRWILDALRRFRKVAGDSFVRA